MLFYLTLGLLFLAPPGFGQQGDWTNYTNNSVVAIMQEEGDSLWVGTEGGLVLIHKTTGIRTLYNASNSGLPGNIINDIALDAQNRKWIATNEGLACFDNATWEIFDQDNAPFSINAMLSLGIDVNGVKWVGSAVGLYSYDDTTWISYNDITPETPLWGVTSIIVNADGSIWCSAFSNQIRHFDGNEWTVYGGSSSGFPEARVFSMQYDQDSTLWVATDAGLAAFTDSAWVVYDTFNSTLNSYSVFDLSIDSSGTIWVGTENGLATLENEVWHIQDFPAGDFGVSSISFDNNDELWVGTWGEGLHNQNGTEWRSVDISFSGVIANGITALATGANGEKYIGTGAGLVGLNASVWTEYDAFNALFTLHRIYDIFVASANQVWFGTYQGLALLSNEEIILYNDSNSDLPDDQVTAIAEDNNGNLWVGLQRSGLCVISGSVFTHWTPSNSSFPSISVTALSIAENGHVWIGTRHGLVSYFDQEWTVFTDTSSGLPVNEIVDLEIGPDGSVWVVSAQDLARFHEGVWTSHYAESFGFSEFGLTTLKVNDRGSVYVGTEEGLVIVHDDICHILSSQNSGLPDNFINALTFGDSNEVWIGTSFGGLALYEHGNISSIQPDESVLPEDPLLIQNYPNPFNPSTTITYELPETASVTLTIFDLAGRQVKQLVSTEKIAGKHTIAWNGQRYDGKRVSTGVYIAMIQAGEHSGFLKMAYLR